MVTDQNSPGMTHPPIDDLLEKVDSKYRLVLYGAKRARQINAYYAQLADNLLANVGPLVAPSVHEKPLTTALREIDAGLLVCNEFDPAAEAEAARESEESLTDVGFADFDGFGPDFGDTPIG